MSRIKSKLRSGESTLGSWVQLPDPYAAHILGSAGFDWIAVDLEHGPISVDRLPHFVQAMRGSSCDVFARVEAPSDVSIKRALDAGVAGIILPMINDLESAQNALSACYYPPRGRRGVGFSFANHFGRNFDAYFSDSNDALCVVIQIEHKDALGDMDQIFQLPGIDAVMVGPYDLSASLNIVGDFQHQDYRHAMTAIKSAAKHHSVAMGVHIVKPSVDEAKAYLSDGYQFIAYGIDAVFLDDIASYHVNKLREIQ